MLNQSITSQASDLLQQQQICVKQELNNTNTVLTYRLSVMTVSCYGALEIVGIIVINNIVKVKNI